VVRIRRRKMAVLTNFVQGDKVKVKGLEPERFKHDLPQVYERCVKELVGKERMVEKVDVLNQVIWVKLDSGVKEWFDPWDLEIIKKA